MARNSLLKVIVALKKDLTEIEQLATATEQWVSVRFPSSVPKFTARHKEIVIRIAFLQTFIAWEEFLDESFTLYLLGMRPPKGKCPRRLHNPSKRKDAMRLIVGDRNYADWTKTDALKKRATKYFRDGEPYKSVLGGHQNVLNDMNIIRNAIAHSSTYSREQFKALVRTKLGTFPPNLSVAKFLSMTMPLSTPPKSFLQFYLENIHVAASSIVPN